MADVENRIFVRLYSYRCGSDEHRAAEECANYCGGLSVGAIAVYLPFSRGETDVSGKALLLNK